MTVVLRFVAIPSAMLSGEEAETGYRYATAG
jgi:hypothetical protein